MSKIGQYIIDLEENETLNKTNDFIEKKKREHRIEVLKKHEENLGNLSTYEILKIKFGFRDIGV